MARAVLFICAAVMILAVIREVNAGNCATAASCNSHGSCPAITAPCVCTDGYTGDDCATADQVPLKISALRTYYSKELRKEVQSRKSGAGKDDVYKSSWEWFSMLDQFLRSQVTPKPSISNMEAEVTSEEAVAPTTTVAATEAVATEHVEWASPPIRPTHAPKRKKNVSSSLQEKLLNTIKSIEQKREQRESCNELFFGKYIASEVSNISDVRKRREFKFKIQQLKFEYQKEE